MEYIKALISLVGDIDSLSKEEIVALNEFTDEKIGLKVSVGKVFRNNELLRSAFKKIKESGKMANYLTLVMTHLGDNIDSFYNRIEEEP